MGKILLYNVNMMKADAIIKVAGNLGHTVQIVSKDQFGIPVGVIAMGVPSVMKSVSSNITIPGELMVMIGLIGNSIDEFLDAYNGAGISKIECKAVLTAANSKLNARQLYDDLIEHAKKVK